METSLYVLAKKKFAAKLISKFLEFEHENKVDKWCLKFQGTLEDNSKDLFRVFQLADNFRWWKNIRVRGMIFKFFLSVSISKSLSPFWSRRNIQYLNEWNCFSRSLLTASKYKWFNKDTFLGHFLFGTHSNTLRCKWNILASKISEFWMVHQLEVLIHILLISNILNPMCWPVLVPGEVEDFA